jgi:hypothetical protein
MALGHLLWTLQCRETLGTRPLISNQTYSVFHRIRQAKFDNGDSILSSSQFMLLPQLLRITKASVKSGQN